MNIPKVGTFIKPTHSTDKGASHLYSVYSEFIHPAFGRPRGDMEAEFNPEADSIFGLGSHRYYLALLNGEQTAPLLKVDIGAASFCLELFWPLLLKIDPFFDKDCQAEVTEKLKEQGLVDSNGIEHTNCPS